MTQTSIINWWRYIFHFQSRCPVTLTFIKRGKISYRWGSPGSDFLTQTCFIRFSRDGFSMEAKENNMYTINNNFQSSCPVTLTYIRRGKLSNRWASPGSNFLTQTCLIHFSQDGFSMETKKIIWNLSILFSKSLPGNAHLYKERQDLL